MITKEEASVMAQNYLNELAAKQSPKYKLIPIFKTKRKRFLYLIGKFIDWLRGHQQLVYRYHDGYEKVFTGEKTEFVANTNHVLENEYCWGFGWNSKKYYDTKDSRYAIIGNGVIIIDKKDGLLFLSPTFRGYNYFMDDYAKYKQGLESHLDWSYPNGIPPRLT